MNNTIDERLRKFATDLDAATDRYAVEQLHPTVLATSRRYALVGAGALALAAVVGGIAAFETHSSPTDSASPLAGNSFPAAASTAPQPSRTTEAETAVPLNLVPTVVPTYLQLSQISVQEAGTTGVRPLHLVFARRIADTLTAYVTATIGPIATVWRTNAPSGTDGDSYTFHDVVLPEGPGQIGVSDPNANNSTILQYKAGDTAVVLSAVGQNTDLALDGHLQDIASTIDTTQPVVAVAPTLPDGYELLSRSVDGPFGERTVLTYITQDGSGRYLNITIWQNPLSDMQQPDEGTTNTTQVRGHQALLNQRPDPTDPSVPIASLSLLWTERQDVTVHLDSWGMTADELIAVAETLHTVDSVEWVALTATLP